MEGPGSPSHGGLLRQVNPQGILNDLFLLVCMELDLLLMSNNDPKNAVFL